MALTDIKIKNLAKGSSLTESLGGRAAGVLFFINRSGMIEAYYRYFNNKNKILIKIGTFKLGKDAGLTSKEIRTKGIELARLREEHPELKEYLEYKEKQEYLQKRIVTIQRKL